MLAARTPFMYYRDQAEADVFNARFAAVYERTNDMTRARQAAKKAVANYRRKQKREAEADGE